jgi:hypothetical protein
MATAQRTLTPGRQSDDDVMRLTVDPGSLLPLPESGRLSIGALLSRVL